MTRRLVLLMSFVLLLSLGSFAILMSAYQERVMAEVTQLASEVGRATLLELTRGEAEALPAEVPGLARRPGDTSIPPSGTRVHEERIVELRRAGAPPPGLADVREAPVEHEPRVEHLADGSGGTVHGFVFVAGDDGIRGHALGDQVVRVEDVHAESRPDGKVELRITTLRRPEPRAADTGEPSRDREEVLVPRAKGEPGAGVHASAVATGLPLERARITRDLIAADEDALLRSGAARLVRKDILLPVPTGQFDDLFAGMRARSLLLLLAVFVVGTLVTAAVATHFTRPIRRLDAAIRRLAEGELDVAVAVRGRDEVARLGTAFNEMARKLRASRERDREMTRREKLTALGRLAAGVAHDVRNPLHSIGLTLDHLHESFPREDPAEQRELDRHLGLMRDEIRRLDRLVENFLRFARSGERELCATDLETLVREILLLVAKEASRLGVTVDVRADGGVPEVLADAESVRAAVLNLVLNSLEAMPGKGALTLRLGAEDGHATLEVADTGHGIAAEDQERVFDFAWTTREKGHGLGLAMVHQVVVEEHGGEVALESRAGQGTCVRLRLPVAGASRQRLARSGVSEPPGPGAPARALPESCPEPGAAGARA